MCYDFNELEYFGEEKHTLIDEKHISVVNE
jgi:hypothetical protein